ncbi:MAG: imidazolonepropionase [Nitrospirae bacterium]|nr:imidazolonepropionase [Nitrospirota bacterium]
MPSKSPTHHLLVLNCGQLLTLKGPRRPRRGAEMGDIGLIRNGAVLMQEGDILAAGPQGSVRRRPEARRAEVLDAQGRVVLPGFVDSHTHALYPASRVDEYVMRIQGRTYQRIAKAGGGIQASARRLRGMTEAMLARRLTEALPQFVRHGTTTVEVKSGYGLEVAQELKMLRAIRTAAITSPIEVVPTLLAHAIPARYRTCPSAYTTEFRLRLIPSVARKGLAEFVDVFCDRGFFSLGDTRRILASALESGLKLKIHAEQLARTGAATLAAGLGAVSADHVDRLSASDIRALAKSQMIATLLPGSVLHLASGTFAPARRLIDGQVPVALATNFNPGSSPTPNMQMILSLACSQMRMTPAEAVTAATINGAYALDRGHRLGSLEAGKQADVAIMDLTDYREIPYYFGMNHCWGVIKRGQIVYKKG